MCSLPESKKMDKQKLIIKKWWGYFREAGKRTENTENKRNFASQ
nr:MAG TPA: hypothetical protein [Caudoviricetes sp.]